MTVVPLWVRCLLAAVLVGSLAAAFCGRPPRRRTRPVTWRRVAGTAAACYGAGCGALLAGEALVSAALVGVGVEALSVAAWLGRARGDDADGDDGGGGGEDDPTDRDGGAPGGDWRPSDDRQFWDYVRSRGGGRGGPAPREREPLPG